MQYPGKKNCAEVNYKNNLARIYNKLHHLISKHASYLLGKPFVRLIHSHIAKNLNH